MGVEVFTSPQEYRAWAIHEDNKESGKSVKHVTVWHSQIIVTWEYSK